MLVWLADFKIFFKKSPTDELRPTDFLTARPNANAPKTKRPLTEEIFMNSFP
jgi:hypothetical protein